MQTAVARYRAVASDEIQFQIATLLAQEAQYLAAAHSDACLMLFQKMPQGGPDYAAFLSQELKTRDVALSGAIIDGGSTAPTQVIATAENAQVQLAPLWARVRNEGFDLSVVGKTPQSIADQKSACLAMSALMQNISRLPVMQVGPADAPPVLAGPGHALCLA